MERRLHSDVQRRADKIKDHVTGIHRWEEEKEMEKRKEGQPAPVLGSKSFEDGSNSHKEDGKYEEAMEQYTLAIEGDESNHILYSNRAFAALKLSMYEAADRDCCKSIAIDPTFVKAYFRRGIARRNLGRIEDSIADFQRVLDKEPKNEQAKIEKEKSIEAEKKKNVLRDVAAEVDIGHGYDKEYDLSEGAQPRVEEAGKAAKEDTHDEKHMKLTLEELQELAGTTPSNSFQFLEVWNEIRINEAITVEFLQKIIPEDLPTFFGNNLPVEVLQAYIELIEFLDGEKRRDIALKYADALARTKRVDILIRFLKGETRNVYSEMLNSLLNTKSVTPSDEKRIHALLRILSKKLY